MDGTRLSLFERLPPEVIHLIGADLKREELAALRLSSRTIKGATANLFASNFHRRQILLDQESLRNFVDITKKSDLACDLRYCTITGVLVWGKGSISTLRYRPEFETDEEKQDADVCTELLTEAFRNIKQRSPLGHLDTLRLCLLVYGLHGTLVYPEQRQFNTRHLDWKSSRTFRIATTALVDSGLTVNKELDLFRVQKDQGTLYGLPSDVILKSATATTLWSTVFAPITTLHISTSIPSETFTTSRFTARDKHDFDFVSHTEEDERGISLNNIRPDEPILREATRLGCTDFLLLGLLKIRQQLTRLETLDVHWISLLGLFCNSGVPIFVPEETQNSSLDSSSASSADSEWPSRRLLYCELTGLFANGPDLVQFLRSLRPQSLSLEDISLGTEDSASECKAISDYLMHPESGLSSYYVNEIFVGDGSMMAFNAPWDTVSGNASTGLLRQSHSTRKEISFCLVSENECRRWSFYRAA